MTPRPEPQEAVGSVACIESRIGGTFTRNGVTTNKDGVVASTTANSGAHKGASDVDGVVASKSTDVGVNELAASQVATKNQGVSTSTAINR